jgi:Ala-tRNA(Pro) deacylase
MKLETYLQENRVAFKTHDHPPAYTAQEVAAEEHVSGKMMAKVVVVWADGKYAMCVVPANLKVDVQKIGKALKAKKVRLADENEMAKLFPDVEVGAEPPFGNLYALPTLVDEHLAADEEIVFQAGSHRQSVRMKYADYASLVKPSVGDLAARV